METTKYYHKNSDIVASETIIYSNGNREEKTYDEDGNILTSKSFENSWEIHTFNKYGSVTSYKNSNGYRAELTYDEDGEELTYTNSDGLYTIKSVRVSKKKFNKYIKKWI